MSKYFDFKNNINENDLKIISKDLKDGKVVIFPTETVYGIGTNGLLPDSVKRIYEIKGRNFTNPINLLVKDINMIESICKDITPIEYSLMEKFFPGPLTLILKKKEIVPDIVTAGSDTVGVRISNNTIVQKLLEYSNVPISAPSANISGKLSGTNIDSILNDFDNKVDYIIDCGNSDLGLESTIVKVIDNIPHILRPGNITAEQIKNVCGDVILDYKNLPSSNLKHYQIDNKSILIYSDDTNKLFNKITELITKSPNSVVLTYSEHISFYNSLIHSNTNLYGNLNIIDLGSINDLNIISKNMFEHLRKAENFNPDLILIEGVKNVGLGVSIMNRFMNICNNNFIEC